MATRKTVSVRLGDEIRAVQMLADGRVAIEGSEARWSVSSLGPDTYRVSGDTDDLTVLMARGATSVWLFVDGEHFEVDVSTESRRQRHDGPEEAVMAPMPAVVVTVLVAPGAEVEAGDTVMVLEAMKMELPIRAPRKGTIKAIYGSPGERVQPGTPLLELA